MLSSIVEHTGAVLPDGCDTFGFKLTGSDRRTMNGFVWPGPGGVAQCDPLAIDWANDTDVPSHVGDGLTVSIEWIGLDYSEYRTQDMLLVAYDREAALGTRGLRRRCAEVSVVADLDGFEMVRQLGAGADLSGSRLVGADLSGAHLSECSLRFAHLSGANLAGANLLSAELRFADLSGANLSGSLVQGADFAHAEIGPGDELPEGWPVERDGDRHRLVRVSGTTVPDAGRTTGHRVGHAQEHDRRRR